QPPPQPLQPPVLDWRTTDRAAKNTSSATNRPTIKVDICFASFVFIVKQNFSAGKPQISCLPARSCDAGSLCHPPLPACEAADKPSAQAPEPPPPYRGRT